MDSACYLRNCTQPGQLTEQVPKIKNLCQVPVTVDEDVDGCEFIPLLIALKRLIGSLGLEQLPGRGIGS